MIKNIPTKVQLADMLPLLDRNNKGRYNYFYLPIDLKSQCSVGFAFINFLDPLFILDFYLEFNCIRWSEIMTFCNSNKMCEIVYGNVQGLEDIKKELENKNLMKKNDTRIKPIILDHVQTNPLEIQEVRQRYRNSV